MKISRWHWLFLLRPLLGVVFAAVIFFGSDPAFAIEVKNNSYFPTFSVPSDSRSEGWFLYTLKPGDRFTDFVTVYNGTDQLMAVRLYPADAVFTSEGAFGLASQNPAENREIGMWARMGRTAVTPRLFSYNEKKLIGGIQEEDRSAFPLTREELSKIPFEFLEVGASVEIAVPPRERRVVPFEISIPLDVEIGDHAGGIVVEDLAVTKKGNISLINRVGVRMYVMVPGERIEKLELFGKEIEEGFRKLFFSVTFKNIGNVRLEPAFQFAVKNPFTGERQEIMQDKQELIFPKQKTTYEVRFEKQGIGVFPYKLYVIAGREKTLVAEGWYIPPASFVIAGVIFLLLLSIVFIWLARRRRVRAKSRGRRSRRH